MAHAQITGAGLGRRLANSIRNQTFPRAGESLDAAALVWSKAPVIVGAHDTGPLIRSKDGFYLAIPTEAAGRGSARSPHHPGRMGAAARLALAVRLSPPRSEPAGGRPSSHQQSRPGGGLALKDRSQPGHRADLLLVPQVKLPKRLNLDGMPNGRSMACRVDRSEMGGGDVWA